MPISKLIIISLLLTLPLTAAAYSHEDRAESQAQIQSNREVNDLRLERRALIEKRNATVALAVQNESDLDLLLRYASGEDLSVLMDKALPAAGSITVGGAVDLIATKKLPARLATILQRLPKLLRISTQRMPTVVGVAAAALIAYDAMSYSDRADRLKEMDGDALKAEHDRLLARRQMYVASIRLLDEHILSLDFKLSPYTR